MIDSLKEEHGTETLTQVWKEEVAARLRTLGVRAPERRRLRRACGRYVGRPGHSCESPRLDADPASHFFDHESEIAGKRCRLGSIVTFLSCLTSDVLKKG